MQVLRKTLAAAVVLLILSTLLGLLPGPMTAQAWWDDGHKIIASRAIDFLPEGWRQFFSKYEWVINETTLYPDTIYKSLYADEDPRHFMDLEVWKPSDPSTGTLHLAVEEFTTKMADAIRAGDWNSALLYAGRVAHYVADIHQPYHSTVYYNPKGLHSVLDSSLGKHIGEMTLIQPGEVGPVQPIANLTEFIFDVAWQSNSFLPIINRTLIDEGKSWSPELTTIIQNRTNAAFIDVARVWVTAIARAGMSPPALPGDNSLTIGVTGGVPAGGLLDPSKDAYVYLFVNDKLGVGFIGTVSAQLETNPLVVSPLGQDPAPMGKYVIYVPKTALTGRSGQNVTLTVSAEGQGYAKQTLSLGLAVMGAPPATTAPADDSYLVILVVVLAAVVGGGTIAVGRRRKARARDGKANQLSLFLRKDTVWSSRKPVLLMKSMALKFLVSTSAMTSLAPLSFSLRSSSL